MRYKIRRIAPLSALRVGCAVGWLVALCPALCLAIVAIQVLQRINQTFQRIEPLDISVLGQPVARIDFLEILRLSGSAQTVARLAGNLSVTFLLLLVLLTLVGAAILAGTLLLFSGGYNLLSALGGGLEVELQESERSELRR
jgi:Transmembrane domain of unknown function (DUF3566)